MTGENRCPLELTEATRAPFADASALCRAVVNAK